jgi:hypothetical protein
MDNDWEYLHGRVDPGQDESLNLVESVVVEVPETADLEQRNTLSSPIEHGESSNASQGVHGMSSHTPWSGKPLPGLKFPDCISTPDRG